MGDDLFDEVGHPAGRSVLPADEAGSGVLVGDVAGGDRGADGLVVDVDGEDHTLRRVDDPPRLLDAVGREQGDETAGGAVPECSDNLGGTLGGFERSEERRGGKEWWYRSRSFQ